MPGKSHGLRSLAGYSPPGHKESDTTELLHFHSHFHGSGGAGGLEGCFQLGVPWEPGRSFLRGLRGMSRTLTKAERHCRRRAPAGRRCPASGRTAGRLWPAREMGKFDEVYALLLAAVTTNRPPQPLEEADPSIPFPNSVPDGLPPPPHSSSLSPPTSKMTKSKKKKITIIVHASSPAKVIKFHSTNK